MTIIHTVRAIILVLLLALPALSVSTSPTIAIINAWIFDATGAAPYRGTLVIRDGRIAALGADISVPAHAQLIDANGKALLPGLFDLHTHWTPSSTPASTPQIATAYLATGVTTVNDFHQSPESYQPRRRWLATLAAPHVHFAARLSTPLGHGADWGDQNTTRWVNSPAAARRAVDAVAAYQPDLIKAFTDGWRYGLSADNTSMDQDTLTALVQQAHQHKLKVFTHTVTVERGGIAARAGVDVIAHSLQDRRIDAYTVQLLKDAGTYYAPTLAVYEPVKPGQPAPYPAADPRMRQRQQKFAYALYNTKTLFDAGVPIAVATDAGMFPHRGATAHELELLVRAGLSPTQALLAGTANSAAALGVQADRGSLRPGLRADLILVDGKPWQDISAIQHVQQVFVDGRLLYAAGAPLAASNRAEQLPAQPIPALLDDFERDDGRTRLDTLRVEEADGGPDRSVQTTTTLTAAEGHGRVLLMVAELSSKPDAYASVILPLSRGAVQPADLRAYRGVRLRIRGQSSSVALSLRTAGNLRWQHRLSISGDWQDVEVPFAQLAALTRSRDGDTASTAHWRGDDLVALALSGHGAPGARIWYELDDVRFY
jgi:imidazolonepropionase-like amidohydrolase